jgi:hypothetical protein
MKAVWNTSFVTAERDGYGEGLMAKRVKAKKKATASRPKAAAKKKSTAKGRRKKADVPSLGRPKVTGEELLFLLFKEDYHARQIFDFLRVQKVKDLEQFSPQQIVRLLSRPVTETVDRIRRKLAEKNRYLREDAAFAAELKEKS